MITIQRVGLNLVLRLSTGSKLSPGWMMHRCYHPLRNVSLRRDTAFRPMAMALLPQAQPQRTTPALTPHPLLFQPSRSFNPRSKRAFTPQYKWDKVPPDYSLVYESNMITYINGLYLGVAFMGVSHTAYVAFRWQEILEKLSVRDSLMLTAVLSMIAIPLVMTYHFARTVPIRIYHHQHTGQFVAVRRTCLGQLRQLAYYPGDVRLDKKKMAEQETTDVAEVIIKGQHWYLVADDFVSPMYYGAHLGRGDVLKHLGKAFVGGPKF